MISEGCLDGVDEVYGYHNWPSFEYGRIAVCPGPIMAHPTSFTILITGKGGHGSQPHMAVDPVLTAAHVIVALQSVVSRNVHSKEQAVLSVTMVHGGEVSNVIPDTVELQGTIRDLKEEVYDTIIGRARAVVNGTCAAFGATATCTFESMCESSESPLRFDCSVSHLGHARCTHLGLSLCALINSLTRMVCCARVVGVALQIRCSATTRSRRRSSAISAASSSAPTASRRMCALGAVTTLGCPWLP